MWPFNWKPKNKPEPPEVAPEEENQEEYDLSATGEDSWDDITGEHACAEKDEGNGKILVKGKRAKQLRKMDAAQSEFCQDIEQTIQKLQNATGKMKALKVAEEKK